MKYTYHAYQQLLALLRELGYIDRNYTDYENTPRYVILRHDIDNSLHLG